VNAVVHNGTCSSSVGLDCSNLTFRLLTLFVRSDLLLVLRLLVEICVLYNVD
jgi:hypothetical protein